MTAPNGMSTAKVGGIALVGVGVIAAVIGLVSLGTGGSSSGGDEAAAPTASVAPATPDTNAVPLPSFSAEPTTVAPTPTPAPVAPPVAEASGAGAGAAVAPTMPLRVYNNSTISGLAATAAADFQRGGWTVAESTNYPDGIIPTSTVYFRPGTGEQASAQRLADEYGLRVEPRFEGIQDASPGLIVIVTRDFKGA
ncbi:LytR C-terminal domain-containing protein [Pseudonocardia sp. WMMC193]|uniref:LytR C-terminal domain-containing protein n=1 Tax=Pseudonocardia sp. WMMC193 TaxID=2911965 RepID=UPI001F21D564|nr:LytR C-terminal domain-containing protein [Pseudonocardia sp. WMMC193]MCF7552840.1 LytR C-terminal domain-containing protein [Pseudonocardia sp. WMMC193]